MPSLSTLHSGLFPLWAQSWGGGDPAGQINSTQIYHQGLSAEEMVEAQERHQGFILKFPLEREDRGRAKRAAASANQQGVGADVSDWSLWRGMSLGAWVRPGAPETPGKFIRPGIARHVALASQR